jgi:hypothetical protein
MAEQRSTFQRLVDAGLYVVLEHLVKDSVSHFSLAAASAPSVRLAALAEAAKVTGA